MNIALLVATCWSMYQRKELDSSGLWAGALLELLELVRLQLVVPLKTRWLDLGRLSGYTRWAAWRDFMRYSKKRNTINHHEIPSNMISWVTSHQKKHHKHLWLPLNQIILPRMTCPMHLDAIPFSHFFPRLTSIETLRSEVGDWNQRLLVTWFGAPWRAKHAFFCYTGLPWVYLLLLVDCLGSPKMMMFSKEGDLFANGTLEEGRSGPERWRRWRNTLLACTWLGDNCCQCTGSPRFNWWTIEKLCGNQGRGGIEGHVWLEWCIGSDTRHMEGSRLYTLTHW